MRALALALALLTATSLFAELKNIMVREGDSSYIHSDGDMPRITGYGKNFAYFELDGVAYAITDPETLRRLSATLKPQRDLGKRQAALGERQAKLGEEQAALGGQQAKLGSRQAELASRQIGARRDEADALSARQRELSEAQRELGAKQRELGIRQRALGDQQRELGEEQRVLARQVEAKLKTIFEQSVRSGVAVRHR
jgi:hypothetical protein